MKEESRDRLRRICLALPNAEERETWGDPTWRVRGRIFAMEKSGDGRTSVWLKAEPGAQDVLVAADPARFFVPPYVGHRGWIGVRLDIGPGMPGAPDPDGAPASDPDWDEVAALVGRSYLLVVGRARAR